MKNKISRNFFFNAICRFSENLIFQISDDRKRFLLESNMFRLEGLLCVGCDVAKCSFSNLLPTQSKLKSSPTNTFSNQHFDVINFHLKRKIFFIHIL